MEEFIKENNILKEVVLMISISISDVYRLVEIKEEATHLMEEAMTIIKKDPHVHSKAKQYWFAHIINALETKGANAGLEYTMQTTIIELESIIK